MTTTLQDHIQEMIQMFYTEMELNGLSPMAIQLRTTIKELIHEEFGDGIMSAIDFSMDIVRQPDPKGDRVNVVLSGKFLPYKQY